MRCYPFRKTKRFSGRSFHGKYQQDVVALIPSEVTGDEFQYNGTVEAAKIQLLFEFTLVPHPSLVDEEPQQVDCAFVQYLAPFADSVNKPLFKHDGDGRHKEGGKICMQDEFYQALIFSGAFAVIRDIWHARGYQLVYETSGVHHYDVLSAGRILGLCPLMRLYRNVHGTIPEWATRQQKAAYPNGIRHTSAKVGSKTYVVNLLGLKFSR
jgi:hypothetical protein